MMFSDVCYLANRGFVVLRMFIQNIYTRDILAVGVTERNVLHKRCYLLFVAIFSSYNKRNKIQVS